jgi:hypothetical protein
VDGEATQFDARGAKPFPVSSSFVFFAI